MIDNRTAAKRKPWMKWYTSDWRAEPTLRLVSRSARSVWVDLLGLMHESTLIGTLFVNGRIPTLQELARVLGDDPQNLAAWLDELKDAGVYSIDDDGAIYSRKMRHAAEISEKGRADIKKRGGAWAPGKKAEKPKRDATRDPNRGAIRDPIPQRLDTRTKEEELEPTLSSNPHTQSSEAIASEPRGSRSEISEPSVSEKKPEPEAAPPPAPAPTPAPVGGLVDFKKELWGRGVAYLTANGASDSHARAQIGKWRKITGSDFEVIQLLAKAEAESVSEPMAFIEGTLKFQKGKTNGQFTGRSAGQPGQRGAVASVLVERYARNRAARAEREGSTH